MEGFVRASIKDLRESSAAFSVLPALTSVNKLGENPRTGWGSAPSQPHLITILRWPKSSKQEVLTSFEEEANRRSSKRAETVKVNVLKASHWSLSLVFDKSC